MAAANDSLKKIINLALAEDRVDKDITTGSLQEFDRPAVAEVIAKAAGIISGTRPFIEVCRAVDHGLKVFICKADGSAVRPGDVVLTVRGRESSILRAERTALNFIQRLSGIATLTRQFVDQVRPYAAVILDTRKTTPGMRRLEKKAVCDGGGRNHRLDLEAMALVKDNHIRMAGGIAAAVKAIRRRQPNKRIEVEVRTLAELEEALDLRVKRIMLDNFPPARVRRAVRITRGRAKLEVSGSVSLKNVVAKARTGVDFISVGALTHSFRSLDLSLDIRR